MNMKKLLKPLTASFLALIISGCSSAPEAISGGLVSADFEISQSTDISASQNDRSEEDLTPEERSAKAREKLISLGNGNVLCDVDDNVDTVEYNGGVMELPCNIYHSCKSEQGFTEASTGCLIAINGILQKISYGEQKDQYMYVQSYEKDDFVKENEHYAAYKKVTFSFEPQINEEDKDLTMLQLTIITVDNPLFRLQPEYPVGFLMHRAATSHVLKLSLNSPIANYTKDEISESSITELDLTDEVIEKYSEMANIAPKAITENTRPFANVDSEYHSHFNFDENGKLVMEKDFGLDYSSIEFLTNNEICIRNANVCDIYTVHGVYKFHHEFEEELFEIIPGKLKLNYTLVLKDTTQRIRLK